MQIRNECKPACFQTRAATNTRVACIGCDFNLPKASAQGRALEGKASIRRYREEVALAADERVIVEGDNEKIQDWNR